MADKPPKPGRPPLPDDGEMREAWDDPLDALELFDAIERKRADDLRELDEAFDYFKADIDFIAGTPQGQRFVYYLLELAGLFRGTFTGNSHGYYLEGRRSIGIEVADRVSNASDRGRALLQKIIALGSWRLNASILDKKTKP